MFDQWTVCRTREDFAGNPDGCLVFVRKARVAKPLAAGPVFLLKFQGQNNFYTIAETFAGANLRGLVCPTKIPAVVANLEQSEALDTALLDWRSGLPAGAHRRTRTLTDASPKNRLKIKK